MGSQKAALRFTFSILNLREAYNLMQIHLTTRIPNIVKLFVPYVRIHESIYKLCTKFYIAHLMWQDSLLEWIYIDQFNSENM